MGDEREDEAKAAKGRALFEGIFCLRYLLTIHINQIAKMKTQTVRKTAHAKKGAATKVVRRKAAETDDDDDTRVKKMVQVR